MPTPRKYASHAERQAAYRRRVAEAARQQEESRVAPRLLDTVVPSYARWRGLTRRAVALLRTVQEEMEAYYEQRSERWQDSERGEAFLERLQSIEEAQAAIEESCS